MDFSGLIFWGLCHLVCVCVCVKLIFKIFSLNSLQRSCCSLTWKTWRAKANHGVVKILALQDRAVFFPIEQLCFKAKCFTQMFEIYQRKKGLPPLSTALSHSALESFWSGTGLEAFAFIYVLIRTGCNAVGITQFITRTILIFQTAQEICQQDIRFFWRFF